MIGTVPAEPTAEQIRWGVGIQPQAKRGQAAGPIQWLYLPTPKQCLFHAAPQRNVLYGGARGGGKSHAMRWDAMRRCLYQPNYRALLVRRTYPELEATHLDCVGGEAERIGAKYTKSDRQVVFANGSGLRFGHCEDDASLTKFLSTEYDAIYFDELVTFTERQFLAICSCARTSKAGTLPVIRAGTNPGGSGSHWVKTLFLDKNPDKDDYPAYDADEWAYIPATLDDNPHIDQVAYDKQLALLPPALRRAWRYGDWDVFEGQYFTEWRRAIHVLPEPPAPRKGVEYIRALDWGYLQPGVCLWIALDPDGRLIVEREYVFKETIAKDVAREIVRITKEEMGGVRVRYTVADPSIFGREGQTGEMTSETFARHGVPLVKATNDRPNGWQRLRHWLRPSPLPGGEPWLQTSPDCVYLNRTIPALVYDMKEAWKSEPDVDTHGEDHAADALRYAVMSRPWPTKDTTRPVTYPVNSIGWLRQQVDKGTARVLGRESVRRRAW